LGCKKIGLRDLARALPFLKKAYALNELPGNLKGIDQIRAIAKPPLFGLKMYAALSRSRIAFNIHGDVAGAYAANIRMFEATGVGTCLLTDWKKNIAELFEPDSEIVTYRTTDECLEKIRWLLDHPVECAEIARRGQARTLRDHTVVQRVGQLHEIIMNRFSRR
jgi:spore maturation protein CgeB